ncbi:MAG TPA: (2Fe-2S)-binding protein [Chloroflexota bacterium]|nr:(2Fe-2S)-binding protein [Chloroflexota bacterium]
MRLSFRLNGREINEDVPLNRTLLDYLRNDLDLLGANKACESGDCGCCIVLRDGQPVCSCLMLAVDAGGHDIVTIEGLAHGEQLHPVQRAFVEKWAIQCGFCTPGMVLSAVALLQDNPQPTEDDIREALAGNLCRCTGYAKIVEAVQYAAELMAT